MPTTIISGAGDRPRRSNGAPGRTKPRPQRFRLLNPKLIRMIAAAASTTPTISMLMCGRPWSGFSRKLK